MIEEAKDVVMEESKTESQVEAANPEVSIDIEMDPSEVSSV